MHSTVGVPSDNNTQAVSARGEEKNGATGQVQRIRGWSHRLKRVAARQGSHYGNGSFQRASWIGRRAHLDYELTTEGDRSKMSALSTESRYKYSMWPRQRPGIERGAYSDTDGAQCERQQRRAIRGQFSSWRLALNIS